MEKARLSRKAKDMDLTLLTSLGVKFVGKLSINTKAWLSTQEKKTMAASTLQEVEVMLLGIMLRAELFRHQLRPRGIVWS